MESMSHLEAIRQYADLHVHIFPCWWITDDQRCACGDVQCKSPGKHPIRDLAPNGHKNATNDPSIIAQWWTDYPRANPALSLAASSLVVIDIDPRNGGEHSFEVLEQKHGRITSDVEKLTGGGGRHIVFVAQEGERFPGKLGAGIDVKHDGYIMVWPSNHVQGHYEWEGEADLIDGAIPSMRPDWLPLPATKEYNVDIRPAAAGMGLAVLLPEEREELRSALATIPNVERDDWVKVGMALHSIDSGKDGFAEWEAWSSTCDKFDPQDQARVWFSFHGKPTQLNKESIFFWAQECGWVNPMKKAVPAEIQAKADAFVKKLFDDVPEVATHDVKADALDGFPVHGLEEVANIIGASAYVNYPCASQLAAVSLACLAASRRYVGSNGESCNVYMGVSSTSVGMIRYTINALQSMLSTAGFRHLFSSSRKSTAWSIYEHLISRPAHLYCIEDFGKMLSQSKKQFGNGSMEHAIDTLSSIYSKTLIQLDQDELASSKIKRNDAESSVIYTPALSILGLVSQDQLTVLTRASEIGSGLMVNMLMAVCDEESAIAQDSPIAPYVPDWLAHQLSAMRGLNPADKRSNGQFDFTQDRGDFPVDNPIVVPLCETATHDAAIMALSDRRSMIPLLHGARVTMRRIAIALAAWGNPVAPVVTPAIMAWSAAFVIRHTQSFIDNFGIMEVGEDGKSSLYQVVLKTIIDTGKSGVSQRDLRNKCHKFRCLDKESRVALLNLLEDDGEILFVMVGKSKVYVASRYVDPGFKVSKWGSVVPSVGSVGMCGNDVPTPKPNGGAG